MCCCGGGGGGWWYFLKCTAKERGLIFLSSEIELPDFMREMIKFVFKSVIAS